MSDRDQLLERIRNVDPAAGLDRDPNSPRGRRIRQQVLHRAEVNTIAERRVPRSRVVAGIAAAMLMLGTVAVASGMFEPDPDDVAAVLDEARESGRAAVKTDEWRPTLRTEQVWCAYEDGVVGSTRSFEFSLDEPMEERHLIAACTDGPDQHRASGAPTPTEFALCEAYASEGELRRAIDEPRRWQVIEGQPSADRPGFPVVLGWDTTCAATTLDTNAPAVELREWTTSTMEATNQARQLEIGLTAAALEQCLDTDQAVEMARHASERLAGDWPILGRQPDGDYCRRVWLDPQLGVLEIGPRM